MKYKQYITGGYVRDKLLDLKSKDIDFTVVVEETTGTNMGEVFLEFVETLKEEGYTIHKTDPDCVTVRGKFPKNHQYAGWDADFVLARKELSYTNVNRRPEVELGTLEDDLRRRDFTVNALAIAADGSIIDLYNGADDLKYRILDTPGNASDSFNEDPLRILRAFRFKITKGMYFSDAVTHAICLYSPDHFHVVSTERIREELHKMFEYSTPQTLHMLNWLNQHNPMLYAEIINKSGIWLMPTTKS